ncbi:DUF6785 family protein [Desulfotalea psychrophila]|nr:DUF6785 family protein [Desulfotalea psychrophila]
MKNEQSSVPEVGNRVRLRAPIIGLLFAMGICLLTPYNNIYLQATPLGGGHFPLAPFFLFLGLSGLTILLQVIRGGATLLSGGELLTIWIQAVIGSGIAYTGFARTFLINITTPLHFAGTESRWQENIDPLIPAGLLPTDKGAIELLYNGIPGAREDSWLSMLGQIPWQAWLQPLFSWSVYILLAYLVMIFLLNIIVRQWIFYERMNFPLLKVPRMIAHAVSEGEGLAFFTNRFLLMGVLLPVILHLLNGLNLYYPSVPQMPTLLLAGPYFGQTGIFSGFHKLKLYFFPAFIGFAFLTSRQISFSFWFFFLGGGLFYGLLSLLGYSLPASELGVTFGPTITRPEEMQMLGAYGVFFFSLVWLARYHLLDVTRRSILWQKADSPGPEWLDVRISFWGAIIGTIALVCWYVYYGTAPLVAVLLVFSFFMITIVATRVICQGGLAYFTLTAAPMDGLIAFLGPKFFTGINALIAGISQKVLFVDLRESLMPSLLQAARVQRSNWPRGLLFSSILLTIVLSLFTSCLAMLTLCYRFGIRELQQDWAATTSIAVYENISRLMNTPPETGSWVFGFTMMGAVVMLLLVVCYQRLHWWPLHPLGYLTVYSSAMRILWLSFFLGWLCNALCMRYGGVRLFKKLQFFFIGLIIGDFSMGGIWAIIGLFTRMSYQVLPN